MVSSTDILFLMSHARWNEEDEHHRANSHQSPSRDPAKSSSSSLLVVPTDLDVLCGRDQRCYNHPGNKKLRSLVSSNLLSYTTAKKRSQKSSIVRSVVRAICSSGGRFVRRTLPDGSLVSIDRDEYNDNNDDKEEEERWYVLDAQGARDKVGHTFRDAVAHQTKWRKKRAMSLPFKRTKPPRPSKERTRDDSYATAAAAAAKAEAAAASLATGPSASETVLPQKPPRPEGLGSLVNERPFGTSEVELELHMPSLGRQNWKAVGGDTPHDSDHIGTESRGYHLDATTTARSMDKQDETMWASVNQPTGTTHGTDSGKRQGGRHDHANRDLARDRPPNGSQEIPDTRISEDDPFIMALHDLNELPLEDFEQDLASSKLLDD